MRPLREKPLAEPVHILSLLGCGDHLIYDPEAQPTWWLESGGTPTYSVCKSAVAYLLAKGHLIIEQLDGDRAVYALRVD